MRTALVAGDAVSEYVLLEADRLRLMQELEANPEKVRRLLPRLRKIVDRQRVLGREVASEAVAMAKSGRPAMAEYLLQMVGA